MPSILHQEMVRATRKELDLPYDPKTDYGHTKPWQRSGLRPDVRIGNQLAAECRLLDVSNLLEYSKQFNSLILVIPLPKGIKQVWLFDKDNLTIAKKLNL